VWARRVASLSLYSVLFLATALALPFAIPWLVVTDVASGDRRVPRTRATLFFAHYLFCEMAGVLGAAAVWLRFLGGALGGATRFVEANAALQRLWSWILFAGAGAIFDFRIVAENAELAAEGPFLLFVRHSSTADTLLASWVVANPNKILLRYVLKKELLWDPCLDIVGRRLPNAFLQRIHGKLEDDAVAVARLARGLDARSGVLIYPEGTRFSAKKLADSVARLRERGHDRLAEIAASYRSVLPPKIVGPLALLAAAPGIDVVFFDQKGFEGAADFGAFWRGALIHKTIRVRLRRVKAADIPVENRDTWLFEQWRETDRFVSAECP
jgi:1-acyl-sn-glycerol-3-phosphate acyltransferase